jgi:hypothetical protein
VVPAWRGDGRGDEPGGERGDGRGDGREGERARGDRAALARAAERARPVSLAAERCLPVIDALVPLFPEGGLPRGAIVACRGPAALSLALQTVAGPSQTGSWIGVVGLPALGLEAVAEAGIAFSRTLLVAEPPPEEWSAVVATLADSVDAVLVGSSRVRTADGRRLRARLRERGSVILTVGPGTGLEPELALTVVDAVWEGIGRGHGHLRTRRVEVELTGRRAAARARRASLWLPDVEGRCRAVEPVAPVVDLRSAV